MASCPNPECPEEYEPSPDHLFCDRCGTPLGQSLLATQESSSPAVSAAEDPLVVTGSISGGSGGGRTIGVGGGNVAGRDVIIQNTVQNVFCLIGGEQIFGDRVFRCPDCNRSPLCDKHFDPVRALCGRCQDAKTIPCPICNEKVPVDQTFTCGRCHRIAGNDHLDAERNWCTECVDRWAGIVEAMEKDQVGISKDGTVVTRDDVVVHNGVLRTKDDKAVATIKENTWYVRRHQWHTVKPKLLQREQQAMRRFYPNLEMAKAADGDLYWKGSVSTWTGNDYEIMLRYPHRFPFAPPRAFVMNPKIKQSRHIYPDGHLCLFHTDDKAWQPETTAATVMTWVSLWLHCYEAWKDSGVWPRQEADELLITTDY